MARPPLPIEIEEFLSWMVAEKGRSANTIAAYRRDLTLRPEAPHVHAGIVRFDPANVIVVDSDLPPAFSNQGSADALAGRIRVSNRDPDGALLVRLEIVVAPIGGDIEPANVLVRERSLNLLEIAIGFWVAEGVCRVTHSKFAVRV